jgi:glutamate dehydrogenase
VSIQEESSAGVADAVVGLARERDGETLARFAAAYLRRAPGSASPLDDPGEDADALLAEVRGAFALADRRDGAVAGVRAFTPTVEEHGYDAPGSVLETNTDDLPFLVDSITGELVARGLRVVRVTHPIVGVRRDPDDGRIRSIEHPRDAPRESVMHFELDRRLTPEELADLEDAARHVLATVRAVVDDWEPLRGKLDRLADVVAAGAERVRNEEDGESEELLAFLRWVGEHHFVFLGFHEDAVDSEGRLRGVDGSGLGLLRDAREAGELRVPAHDPPVAGAEGATVLEITKTHTMSPVHRREPMNVLIARRFDADGVVVEEARLLGLFTTRAYAEPASITPLLRDKLRRILEAEDLIEGSHDSKAAITLFDGFPKGELFGAPTDDLRVQIAALLSLRADEVRLLGRRARDGRGAALVAALPRERYSATLRERLRGMVASAYGTDVVEQHEVFGEDDRVYLHLTVRAGGGLPDVDVSELERRLILEARTWRDRVGAALIHSHGPERGRMLAARWLKRLPESYRAAVDPLIAAHDVERFEALATGSQDFLVGLQDERGPGGVRRTRVAFYRRGPKIELSAATPMLEHLGLRVIEEVPARLHGDDELWLQAFGVLGAGDEPLSLRAVGDRVAESLEAVWRGATETDSLNRLIIGAGLRWPQVQVLRAYRRYRQRIGSRYTEGFQNDVIAANPEITAKQIRLFELRFATDERGGSEADEEALREEIRSDLDAVALLDHDRILRNQLGLIDATVRTNVFKPGRDAMAFKLNSAEVPAIPQPAPLFEIYVYAPDMEGIHLRGGKIARGGIRWSDRMDYRTEVFGLMRAQMTKNAVIVPAGAKGGFFLKAQPDDPAALKDEVKRQYVRYIEAMLDVTDNLAADGSTVPPEGVRVHDENDSYFVVAADKGTATFSDTANAVAVRRGFWLGDAFASGGSAGYDHKGLGITAKGAWESVKRHFREVGVDPERDAIRVVGIGDMSGDVFGNGMLLSQSLKLIAAYDHRHVFLDPDPDPAVSFAERERLFSMSGSSWDDYSREAISSGGGVFSRNAKRIPLTPQVQRALGVDADELAPTDVIRAILRAPVDLLWNGGIGTVVKASAESDADARDRSSDAIRVDGHEVRARVVGEGGNLGFTQRARIEYASVGGHEGGGGLINADFIDNSAGVDCSDHEVNLKILLDLAVRKGELDGEDRDDLLAEVTDDVVQHVLYDSFLQAQILSQEVRSSAARVFAYEDLMGALEGARILRRRDEALPTSDDMSERRRAGRGLVRPELAVLVAYAKRLLTDALLESDLPEERAFDHDVRTYFPQPVVARFGHLIADHPLRRELIATLAANDVVDALGPTFVSGVSDELGAEPAEVVRAFRIAREVTGATQRWLEIEGVVQTLDADTAWTLLDGVDDLVAGVARWYLLHAPGADVEAAVEAAGDAFVTLAEAMPRLRSDAWREEHETVAIELIDAGVPDVVARRHAFQRALRHGPDIIAVASATGRDVVDVAATFYDLGEVLGLEWLEQEVLRLPAGTRVRRWAQNALLDDVLDARRVLAEKALEEAASDAAPSDAVEAFLAAREAPRRRLTSVARALRKDGDGDLAGLTLAIRHLRGLAG